MGKSSRRVRVAAFTKPTLLALLVLTCTERRAGVDPTTGPAAVTVAPVNPTIGLSGSVQLSASARDGAGAVLDGQTFAWISSAPGVVGVTNTGLVTAVGAGSAIVTASTEGVSGTTTVTVANAAVVSVAVAPTQASVLVGGSVQLGATARDASGTQVQGRVFTWTSSDTTRARVSSAGLVTGRAIGSVTITAATDGRNANANISVTQVPVASIDVTPSTVTLVSGNTQQLTATPRDANGAALTGRAITWNSSDTSKARVSSNGLVTARGPGTTLVTASCEQQTFSVVVTVNPIPVASVTVTPVTASIQVNSTQQLTATPRDAANQPLTGRVITWASSAPATAQVNSSGLVLALAAGSATITATSEGRSGTATITVTAVTVPVASVAVTPAADTITVGATQTLVATARDAGGNILGGRTITWTSNNTSRATVSSAGLVTGVSAGAATITATSEGRSGTSSITVTAPSVTADCAAPGPGWIWCDDFEDASKLNLYFEYYNPSNRFTRVTGVGRNGSYGMRSQFGDGDTDGGSLHLAIGRTPQSYMAPRGVGAGTANYRELFWRVYLRHQPGWQGGGGDKLSRAFIFSSSTTWAQAMIAHVWSGGQSSNWNYLLVEPVSGTNSAGQVVTTGYNDFANFTFLGTDASNTPIFDAAHVGQWYCIEAHVRLNDAGQSNGVQEVWINDVLEAQRTGLNFVSSYNAYGLNAVYLENFWNNGSPQAQERYFDNFVVSTQRIGC